MVVNPKKVTLEMAFLLVDFCTKFRPNGDAIIAWALVIASRTVTRNTVAFFNKVVAHMPKERDANVTRYIK